MDDNPYDRLTDKQQAFVDSYVDLGGAYGAGKRAALLAGYGEQNAAVEGSRLLKNPRILAAIDWLVRTRAQAAMALGLDGLMDYAQGYRKFRDPQNPETSVTQNVSADLQFKALEKLYLRSEALVQKINNFQLNIVDASESTPELIDRMQKILGKYGLTVENVRGLVPGQEMAVGNQRLIEADAIEVAAEPAHPETRAEKQDRFLHNRRVIEAAKLSQEEKEIKAAAEADDAWEDSLEDILNG